MRITPSTGSVVGAVSDTRWGQVLLSPQLYGAIEIEDPEGHARDRGIRILSALSEAAAGHLTSLTDVEHLAVRMKESVIRSLILMVPVGNVVYLVMAGEGCVYCKRGSAVSVLLERASGLSGEVREGDTFILATRGFERGLTKDELAGAFDHLSSEEVAEKLTLLLHGSAGADGGAALIFQVKGLVPVEEEPAAGRVRSEAVSTNYTARPPARFWATMRQTVASHRMRRVTRQVHRLRAFAETRNTPLLLVTGILFLLFVASIVLGIRKEAGSAGGTASVRQVVNEAQHSYDEGVALLDLNPLKGRERLNAAKDLLTPVVATVSAGTEDGKALHRLYQQITDSLTMAMQVIRVAPSVFYDASLLKKNATIRTFALEQNTLALLDATTNTVFTVSVDTKSGQVLGGGESLVGSRLIGIHGDTVFVLVSDGIRSLSLRSPPGTQGLIKNDAHWETISAVVAFGGNIYLLDSGASRIWKYVATDTGFSELREYLNPDTIPDFRAATGMAIDGSVWIGTRGGQVLRFTQGKPDTFVPQGVSPPFGTTLSVYTSDAAQRVYVLDSDNKRIVVMDKDGTYVAQYQWDASLQPSQFAVSETNKLVFLLANGKLYSFPLK
ncbi:hypothetical protein M1555_04105 [Patescibacteria group bacterium]|nr:hypothetical protein [Patescibacteria group bacterium]